MGSKNKAVQRVADEVPSIPPEPVTDPIKRYTGLKATDILARLLPRLRKRAIGGWMPKRCLACDYPHYEGRVCDCPHHEAEELLNANPGT